MCSVGEIGCLLGYSVRGPLLIGCPAVSRVDAFRCLLALPASCLPPIVVDVGVVATQHVDREGRLGFGMGLGARASLVLYGDPGCGRPVILPWSGHAPSDSARAWKAPDTEFFKSAPQQFQDPRLNLRMARRGAMQHVVNHTGVDVRL